MPLQDSGPISLGDIRTELGNTGIISLNDADVRSLAGVPSGAISMSNFYGAADDVAIGGVIRDYGIYRSHTFTSSGTFTVLNPASMDYMIVAAGGPGGGQDISNFRGGGGGAGELYLSSGTFAAGSHTVQVGVPTGGTYDSDTLSYSIFDGLTALPGGAGGMGSQQNLVLSRGSTGGSGGGAGGATGGQQTIAGGGIASNNPTLGQGFVGGQNWPNGAGGGGGGATSQGFPGGAGSFNQGLAGAGGNGLLNNYSTGTDIMYSTGGRGDANLRPAFQPLQPGNGGDAPTGSASGQPIKLGEAGIVVIRYVRPT